MLSRLLKKTEEGGFLSGFQASPNAGEGLHISHLLFANDTILFCDASMEQLLHICMVLIFFEAITGLKVNIRKSKIASVGEVGNLDALARILYRKVGCLPMSYLGMPLGAHYKDSSIWNPIIERMEKKLSSWKLLYLSKRGRLTLLKSTLSSLPTYYLSLFTILQHVANRLERNQRNFLWGRSTDIFNFCLLLGRRLCGQWRQVVWGSGRLGYSTKLRLGSGSGNLGMRSRLWR